MIFELAVVTGATSGIGEALVGLLAEKKIPMVVSGRNASKLKQVAERVGGCDYLVVDLQKREDRQQLVRLIREKTPDLCINCAGFGAYGDILSLSVDEQLAVLEVNGAAPLELTLEAARALIKAGKKGVVLNVSSIAGDYPCPGMSVYGGAKSFLTRVSQSLHEEVRAKGVEILVSCPGMVATDFANRAAKKKVEITQGPVLSPKYAAEQIWKQIETRKEKHTFNWQYKLASFLATYLMPVRVVKRVIWKRIKKRL